jgi:DNA repair exonuclease SbcCD ATPase subunit
MKKNILAIFEEVAKINNLREEAKQRKESLESKLYGLIDRDLPLKEKVEARKKFKSTIDILSEESMKHYETISFLNMYSIALKAEAIREAKVIIARNFLDNFSKIDGIPARYKKVKAFIDCLECENIAAHYSEYYENIQVYIRGEGSREEHLYIFKNVDGEAVVDFERLQKAVEYTARTPQEIKENIEKFSKAQKELEALKKEYEQKEAQIKSSGFCLGLDFGGRY